MNAAAEMLEAAPGDLDLRDGVVSVSGAPARQVTLREVVGAYSVFANHGVATEQHLITRVEAADGDARSEVGPGRARDPSRRRGRAFEVEAILAGPLLGL